METLLHNRNVLSMSLTRDEREFACEYLGFTKKWLLDSVEGLSQQAMEVRPGPHEWSIAQCIEHLALEGDFAWKTLRDLLRQPPTPEKQQEVRRNIKQMIVIMTDRSRKGQAMPFLQPVCKIPDSGAALERFVSQRDLLIDYVKRTEDELKNRHAFHQTVGTINLYQFLILEGAHSARHVLQIEEIKGATTDRRPAGR